MLELLPISFTLGSLVKVFLIMSINMFVSYTWYSPIGFQKQWMQAVQWKEDDQCNSTAVLMSNIGALLNSFLLNILLIAFDIRKQQYLSAMLASAILCGFYTFNGWNSVFFGKKIEYTQRRTLYLLDIGFTFVLYTLISFVLISF
ncbi:unnamed protein product [Adineta steineri]|uniref:Uncharacterized protein n=1 Tax=Adineta steineri TaxID=433720 RepID=A0A815DI40_9BILA|nr:unnamed protein product [Adineta steineri]CAF1298150.1 unnamed protein product [Adineta steineri]